LKTRFLNVDLDVFAAYSLVGLARALESVGAVTLHCGRWYEGGFRASFEVTSGRTADATIRRLVTCVQHLPPAAYGLWTGAQRREFNIGIQAGDTPHSFEVSVAPKTVALVGQLGARISVTVYSPDPPGRSGVTR